MPHFDSEVNEFSGSRCFASLYFVSGYLQLAVHPYSYTARRIVTPKGFLASKRALPGLDNATSHFQSSVEPLFTSLRDNMKAWLNDLDIHAADKGTLLERLERFIEICRSRNLFLSAK